MFHYKKIQKEEKLKRPTINDLAKASDVSISTINRILSGSDTVRTSTIQLVLNAAEEIGFYGLGAIEARRKDAIPKYCFGFLLQQSSRELYKLIGKKIEQAAAVQKEANIKIIIDFVDHLEPENIASRLKSLGEKCDAVSIIAADHPLISQTIQNLKLQNTPVITYITDQSASERAGYVGTDNWKLGRTAAWFINKTTIGPGKVAVFIGNHRYQCQDISDAGFRSYMREHAPRLTIADSQPTHEEPDKAYDLVSQMLISEKELVGIYIAGGGISGVLRALREAPEEMRKKIRIICRDLGPETRKGLTEELITAALCHPLEETSQELIKTMINALHMSEDGSVQQRIIPFRTITPENI